MFYIEKMSQDDIKDVLKISAQQFGETSWSEVLFLDDLNKEFKFNYVLKKDKNQKNSAQINLNKNEILIDNKSEMLLDNKSEILVDKNSEMLVDNKSEMFVDTNEKEIIAFIVFMQTEGEAGLEFNITNLAVEERFKRKGYASVLLNFVKAFSAQNDIKKIWLEVKEGNLPAISLYKKLGFKTDYIRKNYYSNGENACVMSFDLTDDWR